MLKTPEPIELKGKKVLVLGLGDTGLSVVNWVKSEGGSVRVADTRDSPPRIDGLSGDEIFTGKFKTSLLLDVDLVCISPGLSLKEEVIQAASASGIPIVGDIELFAWHVRRKTDTKIIAITGTNGKSTVTALTAWLLTEADVFAVRGGNIGPAALAALLGRTMQPDVWVLELSSFQLETTWSLAPDAATALNLSEDHLDRYAGLEDYGAAKARIFQGEGVQVLNRDDPRSISMGLAGREQVTFGLGAPGAEGDWGVADGEIHEGALPVLPLAELQIHGAHNAANALAACALARSLGASREALAQGLRTFRGLPHRLQLVAERGGVAWYDDSKGTNVGATVAALQGLGRPALLIAGGEGKGQDFSPLAPAVAAHARRVLLIGRDAPAIERALAASGVPQERCATLEQAVARAAQMARSGEAVLLSPACASFDMFRDYRHRGEVFAAAVQALGGLQ